MPESSHQLQDFIFGVRWRLIFARTAERCGVGILAGCAIAAILGPILVYRGQAAMPVVMVCLAMGAVLGLFWAIAHLPTTFEAAAEADRQLDLADLLSTAWTTPTDSTDPWSATVLAIAHDRCRSLSGATLVLNRWGARAWGGVGLAMALVVTIGLMSTTPTGSSAAALADRATELAAREGSTKHPGDSIANSVAGIRSRPGERELSDDHSTRGMADEGSTVNPSHAGASNQHGSGSDPNGGGPGFRQTRSTQTTPMPNSHGDSMDASSHGPLPAAGGTGTTDAVNPSTDGNAGRTTDSAHSNRTAPWQTTEWPKYQHAADAAVRNGDVPDDFRDIVGEYFK